MALEKSKLIIEIEAKNSGLSREIYKTKEEIRKLGVETVVTSNKSQKALNDLEIKYNKLSKSMKEVMDSKDAFTFDQKSTLKAANDFSILTKEYKKFTKAIEANSDNMSKLSSSEKNAINQTRKLNKETLIANKSMDIFDSAARKLSTTLNSFIALSGLISIFNIITAIVQKLSDPKFTSTLEHVLTILAAMAKLRGFDRLSSAIISSRNGVENLEKSLDNLNNNGSTDLADLAEKADLLNNKLNIIPYVAKGAWGALTTTLTAVQNIFTSISQAIQGAMAFWNNFNAVFESISDPEKIEKFAKILKLLSFIAKIKGQSGLADRLIDASESITKLGANVRKFTADSSVSFDRVIGLVELLNRAITVVATSFGVVGVAVAVFTGVGIGNSILRLIPAFQAATLGSTSFSQSMKMAYKNSDMLTKSVGQGFGQTIRSTKGLGTAAKTSLGSVKYLVTGGLFPLVEAGIVLGPVLGSIGYGLLQADNAAVKFMGTFTILTGVILAGYAALVTFAFKKIGSLFQALGESLIASVQSWEDSFVKAQSIMQQFTFTIISFGEVFGEKAVGNIDTWIDVIERMTKTTVFSMTEIQKATTLLIAEGSSLGLSLEQNIKVMSRAADIASSSHKPIEDVIVSMNSALMGQSQALGNLGVNVSEAAVKHSKYSKSLTKTLSQLSDMEMVQARYNTLMENSIAFIGSAEKATDSIMGANQQYEKSIKNVQQALGEQSYFTVIYINFLKQLVTVFLDLPKPIIQATGALLDFAGVILKIVGTIMMYVGYVITFTTVMGLASMAITSNLVVQKALTKAMSFAAAAVGVETVAVTSLKIAMSNLGIILMGDLRAAMSAFMALLISVTAKIWALSVAVLTNPLFIKYMGIAAGISLIVLTLVKMKQEIQEFLNLIPDWVRWLTIAIASLTAFRYALNSAYFSGLLLNKFLRNYVLSIKLYAALTYGAITANTIFASSITVTGSLIVTKFIPALKAGILLLRAFTVAVLSNPLFWSAAAIAASIYFIVKVISELRKELSFLDRDAAISSKNVVKSIGVIEKITDSLKSAFMSVADIFKNIFKVIMAGLLQLSLFMAKAYVGARSLIAFFSSDNEELTAREMQIEEINNRINQLTNISTSARTAMLDLFGGSAFAMTNYVEQISEAQKQLEIMAARKKEIDTLTASIDRAGISVSVLGNEFEKAQYNIKAATDEQKKLSDEFLSGAGDAKDILSKLKTATESMFRSEDELKKLRIDTFKAMAEQEQQFKVDQLRNSGEIINAIKLENEIKIKAFEEQAAAIQKNIKLTKDEKGQIDKIREAMKEAASRTLTLEFKEKQQKQQAIAGDVGSTFGGISEFFKSASTAMGSTMQGVMGSLSSTFSSMAASTASMIIGLILKIPELLDGVANLVDTITNFPIALFKAFGNVFNSLVRFVANFIPNLIQSVIKSIFQTADFIEGIAEAFVNLVETLPDLLINMLEQLPEAITRIISSLISGAGRAIAAYVKLLLVVIPKIIVEIVKAIPAILRGIRQGFKDGFKDLFGDMDTKISDGFNKAGKKLRENFDKGSEIFKVSDLGDMTLLNQQKDEANKMIKDVKEAMSWLEMKWKEVWNWMDEKWKGTWRWIDEKWKGTWNWIDEKWKGTWLWIDEKWKGTWNWIDEKWKGTWLWIDEKWKGTWNWVDEKWKGTWLWIDEKWKGTWNWVDEKWKGMWSWMDEKWKGTWNWVDEKWKGMWTFLADGLQSLWDKSFGKLSFAGLQSTWDSTFGKMSFDGLKQAWDDSFGQLSAAGFKQTLKDLGSALWDGLNPQSLIDRLFPKQGDTKGTVEKILSKSFGSNFDIPVISFAQGTKSVPGTANVPGDSMINDKILALLSPGESVIPRSKMRDPAVRDMVDRIMSGNLQPMKLAGGMLGKIQRGATNIKKSISVDSAKKVVKVIIDPKTALWDTYKDAVMSQAMRSAKKLVENFSFDEGGKVSSDGIAKLHKNEIVLARPMADDLGNLLKANLKQSKNSGGGTVINVAFNIKTSDKIDDKFIRDKVWPEFKVLLRRDSLDGKRLIERSGIG